ncbi:hypothetical protein ACQPZG_01530 (plasmid) [Streptomyces sp. CA-294286]|uniref:hypothetical protein n=1 Tax=Streptomyces sp. CA-294286 TaxID=3240070 RepID=UPI003D8D62C9
MHRIEFFTYPSNAPATGSPLVGVRVDGTDLRTYAADATFELRLRERGADGDGDDAEDPDFADPQHNGLSLEELGDLARHFHGDPVAEFTEMGDTPVLGCLCGVWACWPLLAVISLAPDTVTWSGFRQPHREEWGELPLGPYVFPRAAYDAALSAPERCAEDPLGDVHDSAVTGGGGAADDEPGADDGSTGPAR